MQPESGRPPEPNGEPLLPPATTQWQPLAQPTDEAALPLAPFFPGSAAAGAAEPMPWEAPLPPEPMTVTRPQVEEEAADEWQPEGADGDFPSDAFFIPDNTLLDADSTLQPEASAHLAGLAAEETSAREDDTIVLLDQSVGGEELERDLVEEVAAQLEQLAARLREGGFAALSSRSGGAVDTVLAAVLSGYVAARAR